MGITHGDQQDYGEAIRFLKKSILIDSTYAQAHFALAVNYYFAGKYDSAQIHVKRAQDLGMEVKREFISEVESRQR
jgi:tetratricopeptide (TPR) repeat protein